MNGSARLDIQAVAERPPPRLSRDDGFSASICDFVAQCLRRDPRARPTAQQLLLHPFITGERDEESKNDNQSDNESDNDNDDENKDRDEDNKNKEKERSKLRARNSLTAFTADDTAAPAIQLAALCPVDLDKVSFLLIVTSFVPR